MKSALLFTLKTAGLALAVTLSLAQAAHAEDGVVAFGKLKFQAPPASDVEHPKVPYVSGQVMNAKEGPLRIQAMLKQGNGTMEAVIDFSGSIESIAKTKTFQVSRYQGTPGKVYMAVRVDNMVCVPKDGGTVTITSLGKQKGDIISGTFKDVQWYAPECPAGSGSFKVERNEDY
jgi:hypothetical protein